MGCMIRQRDILLALGLTIVSMIGITVLLRLLGPDWAIYAPATCTTTRCFCEFPRAGSLIVQPANSWSSYGYAFAGFLMIVLARGSNWRSGFHPVAATVFGLTAIFVGLGSVLLHATLTLWGQFFDVTGMYFTSGFMLVSALACWRGLSGRQAATLYVLLVVLAIACYNGLAAQYLWDESPRWADASQAVMGALTSGAALFFVHRVSGAASFFSRRWSLAVLSLSAAGVLVAAVFTLVPRYVGVTVLMAYVIGTALLGLWLAMKIWQRGDHIGVWLAAAHGPLVVVALMILLRAAGWVSLLWVVQWGLVAALLVQAPLLMMALQLRSRERHDAQNREQAMFTHDPLTGLLSVHMFDDRLRQTIVRARSHREDAAIVLVQVVNYPHILRALGTKVADQSLLSAVLKLRRVVRDVDTVCRVNESTFGLILEGISARNSVTRVASRMVALGLMPVEGIVPQVTLQFHFASVVLHEYVDDPEHILEKLNALLSGMSVRTRRPIRFLELPETMAQAYASQSNSGFDASIDPLTEHSTVPPSPTPLGTPLRLATHRP